MILVERLQSKKLRVTETVLGSKELSAKGGGTLQGSVKLPSRDVYQGFLDHEAEGLGEKRKKARTKAEDKKKKKTKTIFGISDFSSTNTPRSKSLI